jgi:hypothetical protein
MKGLECIIEELTGATKSCVERCFFQREVGVELHRMEKEGEMRMCCARPCRLLRCVLHLNAPLCHPSLLSHELCARPQGFEECTSC